VKLILGGDSHTVCLREAMLRLKLPDVQVEGTSFGTGAHLYEPFFAIEGGDIVFTHPHYARRWLKSGNKIPLDPEAIYVLMAGLNSNAFCLDRTWRRFRPPGYAGEEPTVSQALLRAMIANLSRYARGFYLALKERGMRVIAAPAPPPPRGHFIFERHEPAKVIHARQLYLAEMRRFFEENGIPYVLSPPEVADEDGYLKPQFRVGIPEADPHHANLDYGELVARDVIDVAKTL